MKKVAFITGAGGFLGGETAVALAKSGISVAISDINAEALKETTEKIEKIGGDVKAYVADVTDSKSIEDAIVSAAAHFGRLDIMIHAAGGSARIVDANTNFGILTDRPDYVIDGVIKVNLYGAIWASRAAARIMLKQGEGGKIINFSSAVGLNGMAGCCDYAASKGGIMSFTKSLAKELGEYKINVNSIAPGVVCPPSVDLNTESGKHRAYGTNILGEMCKAEDVANLVEFLVSEKANFITGQTYVIDGGRTLSMKGTD